MSPLNNLPGEPHWPPRVQGRQNSVQPCQKIRQIVHSGHNQNLHVSGPVAVNDPVTQTNGTAPGDAGMTIPELLRQSGGGFAENRVVPHEGVGPVAILLDLGATRRSDDVDDPHDGVAHLMEVQVLRPPHRASRPPP